MLDHTKIYTQLNKDLFELDKERRNFHSKVKPYRNMFWGWVLTGAFILYWLFDFTDYHPNYVIFLYLLIIVIFLFMYVGINLNYTEQFRELFTTQVAPKIISGLGDSFTYEYKGGISESNVRECLLFPLFHKYYHQDLISGSIAETSITFNEIKLHAHAHRGGEKKVGTVFEGIFFVANIQVSFPTDIWFVTRVNSKILKDSGKTRIQLDHPGINRYEIYTDDEEIALKVLQPFILEKITSVNDKIKKNKISSQLVSYHFGGNRVELAIRTRRKIMDPRLSKSINNVEFIKIQTSLLNTLYDLISNLTLK